jgi:hypothetical protein
VAVEINESSVLLTVKTVKQKKLRERNQPTIHGQK